jgi:hypothetical protein
MSIGFARRFVRAAANAKCQTPKGATMKRMSRGEFFARQKADAWERARAHDARNARETAETLIEDRGPSNAREWAVHCATRDTSGFWPKVLLEIDRQSAAKIFAIARARRAEARGQ